MAKRMSKERNDHSDSLPERLLEFAEKERFTVLTATLYLIMIGVVRSLSESYAGEYVGFGIPLLTQHIMLYFAVFFPGAIAISVLADIDMKKVVNVQLFGFWINMLPAFFDLMIYGRSSSLGRGYEFISLDRVLTPRYWIDPVYAIEGTPIAFKIMLLLLPVMPAAYVAVKWYLRTEDTDLVTRIGNMAARTIATFYGVWLVIAWIGALMLFMRIDTANSEIIYLGFIHQPILTQYYTGIGPWGDAFFMANEGPFLVIQQRAMMMALDYVIFFIMFLIPVMHLWRRGSVLASLKMLDPMFLIYSGAAYMLGIMVAGTLYPLYIFHWPYIIFGYLLFVCVWEAVRFASFDRKEDTKSTKKKKRKKDRKEMYLYGVLSEKNRKHLPLALITLAVLFAANLGPLSVLMLLAVAALGYAYIKAEKNKIRRLYISSSVGILAFLNGIITPSMWFIKEWNSRATSEKELLASVKTVIYYRNISFTPEMLLLGLSLFLIGIALMLMKTDMLSIAPDKKEGLKVSGVALLLLSLGMLLPVIVVATEIMMVAPIGLLFVMTYMTLSIKREEVSGDKEKTEKKEKTDRRMNYALLFIMLELLLLVIKYSGML